MMHQIIPTALVLVCLSSTSVTGFTSSSLYANNKNGMTMQLGGAPGGFTSSRGRQDLLSGSPGSGGGSSQFDAMGTATLSSPQPQRQSGGTPSFEGLAGATANRHLYGGGSTTTTTMSSGGTNPGELAIDISEDAPRNIHVMKDIWSNEMGIQKSNFDLAEDTMNGHGELYAMTTSDMPTGTPVLYVPNELILSSNKAMDELRTRDMYETEQTIIANGGGEEQLPQFYLMLKLLLEIQKGHDSSWYPWLNSLPRYFSNAASMTDYCLLCLPPLMRKLSNEERLNQQLLCHDTLDKVPFLSESIKSSSTFVKWVYQIVYTRAVQTEDLDYKIIPLADYFNHGSEYTEIDEQYDENGNYYAYTSYDVVAGSPLRISYAGGTNNPSHLLARYGFLDEDCPASYCKLLPPTVNQDMLDLGYSYERMLFYKSGEVADEVWDIFLYDVLNSVNSNEQQALMNAHRTGDYASKQALHEKYYTQTSTALLEHIENFIEDIDKLIHKAETIGVNDQNSPYIKYEHPRLPLIHRHNLFVRETFQAVRNLYSPDAPIKWREATRYTVQECDEVAMECAMAECVEDANGNWECEGGLGPNADGSERPYKTQQVIMQHS